MALTPEQIDRLGKVVDKFYRKKMTSVHDMPGPIAVLIQLVLFGATAVAAVSTFGPAFGLPIRLPSYIGNLAIVVAVGLFIGLWAWAARRSEQAYAKSFREDKILAEILGAKLSRYEIEKLVSVVESYLLDDADGFKQALQEAGNSANLQGLEFVRDLNEIAGLKINVGCVC